MLLGQRPLDDDPQLLLAERLEPVDAEAGEKRRVELVVRVLGGRPDEHDRPVLDVRQERVLLCLVEPMQLVDEQDGAAAGLTQGLGG